MSKLKVILEKTEHFYSTYKDWSEKKGFPVVSDTNLGTDIFVCYLGETPIYSCCLYRTDSNMALVGFPLANSDVPKDTRKDALPYLFKRMSIMLKDLGYTKIWTTSGTPPIMDVLEREKYINADPNVNVYIKVL